MNNGRSPLLWAWNPDKNDYNRRTHGIAFEVAANVFDDPFAATFDDPYPYEQRWRTIGMVGSSLIIVVHTWHEYGYVGRIISARMATRYERFIYEEGE